MENENEQISVPVWRTAQQCCDMIKAVDKDSGITRFYIVKLANQEQIRSLKSGRKILVDYNSLIAYLNGTEYKAPAKQLKI